MSYKSARSARHVHILKWVMSSWGIILCLNAGCGYQFTVEGPGPVIAGGTGVLPQEPPVRLAMHTFKNNSFEPNLEFKLSRYLRQAMQSTGGADFVDDDDVSADYLLEGAILSVRLPSTAFSRTQTRESRVVIRVGVSVKHRKTGKILWSSIATSMAPFFVGATSLSGASSGLQFNRVLQDRAIEQAGQLAAADLADRFLWARDQGHFQVNKEKDQTSSFESIDSTLEETEPQDDLLP